MFTREIQELQEGIYVHCMEQREKNKMKINIYPSQDDRIDYTIECDLSGEGICAKNMMIEIKNDIIVDLYTQGGCAGNAIGIANLVKGQKIQDVIERLEGIKCGNKNTSCPDKLAEILKNIAKS